MKGEKKMSSCKRWIAALIAAVIMVSLAVPAWAVDTYTLSITSETKGHNYKAYQVFGGTIAKALHLQLPPSPELQRTLLPI